MTKSFQSGSLKRSKSGGSQSSQILLEFENLLENKKLDLEVLSTADYVCINLDLILYKNEDLLNKAFSLLVRFHSQRKSLYNLLKQIQMVENSDSIRSLKIIENKL
jgi:hypothetical protein